MPTARLDFGGQGFSMDGVAASTDLGVRDFFALGKLDEDPRFDSFDGSIATNAQIHVALWHQRGGQNAAAASSTSGADGAQLTDPKMCGASGSTTAIFDLEYINGKTGSPAWRARTSTCARSRSTNRIRREGRRRARSSARRRSGAAGS